jgi:thiol-disulfide isomerase/thioredoxin
VAQTPSTKKKSSSAAPARGAGARNATPVRRRSGRPAGLFTWIAVGLVLVVVVALIVIKVTGGSPNNKSTGFQATDPAIVADLTTVPSSVFDTVGIKSPVSPVYPPIGVKGQPPLTATTSSGAKLPEVLYVGAEWCPYCAAERWAMIVALSRFGTFTKLGDTTSSSIDVYPNTPTLTFAESTFTSKYLVFKPVEMFNNVINPATNNYTPLQTLSKANEKIVTTYESSKYIPGWSGKAGQIYYPFVSIGNRFLIAGPSYTPALLQGQTRTQIASGLSNPTSPITQAIIAASNYLTASLCVTTKDQPSAVCNSSAVLAAKKALGLK